MPKALQEFYSFRVYQNREDYETKTGKTAPPWNPNRALKHWADENPTNTEFDELRGEEATYRPVMAIQSNGRYREGPDGQPVTGAIRLPIEEAKTYNFLPPKGIVPIIGELLPYGAETNTGMGTTFPNSTKITAAHIANAQRTVQPPLNLPEGSRVAYAPGIGAIAVVLLKGESLPTASTTCGLTPENIAEAVVAKLLLAGFLKP